MMILSLISFFQIKDSLSPKNQTLIPALIKGFNDLHIKMLEALDAKLNEAVSKIESKFIEIIQLKDVQIDELKATNADLQEQVTTLDEKLDALNAHFWPENVLQSL